MRSLFLAGLALATLPSARLPGPGFEAPQEEATAAEILRAAPKRIKIGRMRGLRVVSDVTFVSLPDEPHELTMTAAFPARSRLALASRSGRTERFQLGRSLFGLDVSATPGASDSASYPLVAAGRAETELDLALRRAVFLWPDEGDFVGAGTTRTAKVAKHGVLLATLDPKTQRPQQIRALDANGRTSGVLQNIRWREGKTRWWPTSMEFALENGVLWSESVRAIEDQWLFNDAWFLPPDRIEGLVDETIEDRIRMRVREECWVRRTELEPGSTLAIALERAGAAWSAAVVEAGAGGGVSDVVAVALDDDDAPVAFEIEARPGSRFDSAPGWTQRHGVNVWTHLFEIPDTALSPAAGRLRKIAQRSRDKAGAERPGEITLRIAVAVREEELHFGARSLVIPAVSQAPPVPAPDGPDGGR